MPSKNSTVPVGVAGDPPLVSVAVKITVWPAMAGFGVAVSVIDVVALATVYCSVPNDVPVLPSPR